VTTIPAGPKNDLALEKFEAEVREAEARLNVLEADAKARQARADMDEISGLTGIQTGIRHQIAELKHAAAQDYAQTQADVKDSIAKLQAAIKRLDARLAAWDEAADRRLNAQLDKAEAKLEVWKAQADQRKAERGMKRQDELDELANELAKLNETIALARARSAEAKHEEYSAKSQAAVHEAALRFNEAFDIASARYDK
jgi:hypothetical protein